MADVIGRGHGGDGAGDPPPPGGDDFWRGHQEDVPPKKVRGMAKNFGLRKALDNNKGRPLEIPFDTEATNMPVGQLGNYFTRELGLHMWRSVPLDREGWKNVPKETKNAVYEHMKGSFDLDAVEKDLAKKGGVKAALQKRFKDRKNMAKQEFLNRGGYGDVERARTSVPDDMTNANWQAAIDHFTSPEHIKRSLANQAVRQQQVYTNRGGTSSYANVCYNQEQIAALMENPQYRDQLLKMVGSSSQMPSHFGNEHDGGDDDDEDDD